MYRDRDVCRAVYEGVPQGTPVCGLAGTFQEETAKELGLPFVAELYGKQADPSTQCRITTDMCQVMLSTVSRKDTRRTWDMYRF